MTHAQIEEFRGAFNQVDRNASGTIDCTELKLLFETMGHAADDKEIAEMMALADGDNSGEIDFVSSTGTVEPETSHVLSLTSVVPRVP